jgi:hypothetical protein
LLHWVEVVEVVVVAVVDLVAPEAVVAQEVEQVVVEVR